MVLRYEDLCAEPDAVSRKLFEFSGLPWSKRTEAFIAESTESRNRSGNGYFSVKRDPLISAFKWKKQLDRDTVQTIYRIVADSHPGNLFPQENS